MTDSTIKNRDISPNDEAEQIAVDATESLLPDQKLIQKIPDDVKTIRAENLRISKILNNGRKVLGKLEVENFNEDLLGKINQSEFATATAAISNNDEKNAAISFSKNYNPEALSRELFSKTGIKADPIWLAGPDYGHINYDLEKDTYTFREGWDTCEPNKRDRNRFWEFRVTNGKSELIGKYATCIPLCRSASGTIIEA